MKKRFLFLAVLLVAICTTVLMMPVAAAEDVATGGTCGAGLIWTLNDAGVLTISGSGTMTNYSSSNAPWVASRESITKIVIEDSVTSIGNYAFYNCINLNYVVIGSGVVTIGEHAFYNCTALTEVVVPDNVATIGSGVFRGTSMEKITVPFVGNTMTSTNAFSYIFNTVPETLRNVTITKDTTIPASAFKNLTLIESVTLPTGVESIGNETFYGCTALLSVNMGWDSLTSIGNSAFRNCIALKDVGCGDYVISIPSKVRTLGTYAFAGCVSFTTLTVDMAGTIGEGAFDGCTGVTGITIGDEVTTISAYAFRNTMITEIVVPDNVTSIGDAAFKGCPLVSMTLPFIGNSITTNDGYNGVFGFIFGYVSKGTNGALTSTHDYTYQHYWYDYPYSHYRCYYIPKTLRHVTITQDTTIPSGAFWNCDLIETIVLPENVETVNGSAFQNCTALQSVDMGWENISSIGNSAFRNCPSLVRIGDVEKVIPIPANVTTLGTYAFAGCTQFATVSVDMVGTIGEGAFDGCTGVTGITIGDEVTTISAYAFRNTMITEIVVPDNVTSIGVGVFKGCPLVSMTLPFIGSSITTNSDYNGVFGYIFDYVSKGTNGALTSTHDYTYQHYWYDYPYSYYRCYYIPKTLRHVTITLDTTIPTNAFLNCDLIETIVLPENVETVNGGAFQNCTALQSVDMGWENISSIGNSAFRNCPSLVRIGDVEEVISIPANVTTLGTYAFAGCTQFTTVSVDMVGAIGEGAFDGCTGVTGITIGDEVTTIGNYAFRNTTITEIVVPDNVTSIGDAAFKGCPLVSMTLPFIGNSITTDVGYNGVFGFIFGYVSNGTNGALTSTHDYTYQHYWTDYPYSYYRCYYIPKTLRHVTITLDTTIPTNAFWNCDLIETIVLPENVETVNGGAFQNCTALQSVDMGWENISSIGNSAFRNCPSLVRIGDVEKVIAIPSHVTTLGTYAFAGCTQFTTVNVDMTGAIGDYAFNDCTGVTSITVGDGVTSIGAYAFNGCTVATSITIGNSVTSIGGYAFRNTKITEIVVPDSVTSMGTKVFEGCPLVSMTIPFIGDKIEGTNTFSYIFNGVPATLKHVTITMDTTIPASAFKNCALIETVILPEGVTGIGNSAFESCTALKSVDMGWDALTSIGEYAFYKCENLLRVGAVEKEITIPTNVTYLGQYAFARCFKFEAVTVNMVGSIGVAAFENITALTSLTIGNQVTSIGNYAFKNTALTTVTVPENVTSIGSQAFAGCPLVSMTIPFIGDKIEGTNTFSYIFNGVPATLKHVTVTMDTTIPASAFKSCALIETITLPEGVVSIGNEAFRNCTALQSVDMGWGALTTIGNYAFQNCTSLIRVGDTEKIISIPSNVTTLGEYAFSNCEKFETAIINVTGTIGRDAFSYCDKLTSVTIGDCVTTIGSAPFYECKALGAVSIASSVTKIDSKAFYHCTGLRHVLYKGTEEDWNAMTIGSDNDYLKGATRHYECSGNEVVDPENNVCQICCVHVFAGQLQHADATCTEGSYDKKVCTICAYFEKLNETEPLGHEYTETKVPVTCTSQGYTLYECGRCGHSYIAGYTEVKGHNYNAVVTDPTCANAGYTTHTCIDCGHRYVDSPVEALGHLYQGEVTAPTCTKEGYTTYTCAGCGGSYKADYVSASEHSYNGTVTAPTCTAKGFTTFLCSVCGHSYKGEYVDKIAHDYSATVIEPTCTKGGYTSHVCVNCGDSYQSDQVAALEHNYTETVIAPTCTENGYTRHVCADCGKTYDDAIVEALGHSYDATVFAPTCTEIGYTSYLCSVCGDCYFDQYIELTEHSFAVTVVPPSCTAVGYTQKLCQVCGEEVFVDYVEMTDHDYVSTVVEPTCSAGGYTSFLCSVCAEAYTSDPTQPLAHDYAETVTAPSCSEQGYTTYVCRNCGQSDIRNFVEATGHSWVEANCTAAKFCSACGQKEGEALGHNYVATVTAPTCIEDGYTTHVCSRCGDSRVDHKTGPLGHNYVYKLTVTPTAAKAGNLLGACSVCEAEQNVLVPALNEERYECVVEKQPTYIEEGVMCYVWKEKKYGDFLFRVSIPVMEITDATIVQIGSVHGNPGKTVDVVLSIQDAPALKSIAIGNLVYDREHLTLVSAQWLVTGQLGDWNSEAGKGVLAFENSSYVNGELLKLTFQIHEDAPEATYQIDCEVILKEAVSGVELQLPLQLQQGSIIVQHYEPGDVNGDGKVNTDDAIYLLYNVMFGDEDYPVNQECDFDGNGKVNTDDAIYLLYYVMFGAEDYPLH